MLGNTRLESHRDFSVQALVRISLAFLSWSTVSLLFWA